MSCGSTAGIPTSGSNWLQFTVVFGFARLAPNATCCSGNRCPAFAPVAATVNGASNSGGAADVYVYPYGGFALMIPADNPSYAV